MLIQTSTPPHTHTHTRLFFINRGFLYALFLLLASADFSAHCSTPLHFTASFLVSLILLSRHWTLTFSILLHHFTTPFSSSFILRLSVALGGSCDREAPAFFCSAVPQSSVCRQNTPITRWAGHKHTRMWCARANTREKTWKPYWSRAPLNQTDRDNFNIKSGKKRNRPNHLNIIKTF